MAQAPKLKDLLNADLVRELASELSRAHPPFDRAGFVARSLRGLERLELTERAHRIAEAMREFLPPSYSEAVAVLVASIGPEVPPTGENGTSVLRYMPHVSFVQKYGLDHFEASMQAQCEITKRFTAEWSIRAFLEKYPEQTYARMLEWARDDNAHLRRLASEGTRPRLPWGARLRRFQQDPSPVIRLLEILKDDPERYVQRSVANNLNDIAKDHPDLVVELCRRWSEDAPPGRAWIVNHALRSLVKSGHRGALGALGAGAKAKVEIGAVGLEPPRPAIGGKLRFSFEIASKAKSAQNLIVDYAVHFMKSNGGAKPKVFKLRRLELAPLAKARLQATISFADMTTRRHYPGRHRIEVLINGAAHPLAEFDLRQATKSIRATP